MKLIKSQNGTRKRESCEHESIFMAWALDLISFLLPPDMKINTIFFYRRMSINTSNFGFGFFHFYYNYWLYTVDFFTKGVDKIRYVPVTIMTVCMQQQVWMI